MVNSLLCNYNFPAYRKINPLSCKFISPFTVHVCCGVFRSVSVLWVKLYRNHAIIIHVYCAAQYCIHWAVTMKTVYKQNCFTCLQNYSNYCSPHIVEEWILTSQHWATLQKADKRARQIQFIVNNMDSKANVWFYFDIHHSTWLFLNGQHRNTRSQ